MTNNKQKIVTIGGGTGSFVILSGLKKFPVELSAVVNMVDSGGSTGRLRKEHNILPTGDIRQCIAALADPETELAPWLNHRYVKGNLAGHAFGNMFLMIMSSACNSLEEAIKMTLKIVNAKGKVYPATFTNTHLKAVMNDGEVIIGEDKISGRSLKNLKIIKLSTPAQANKGAIKAIMEADKIVINPGSIYNSVIPIFLVSGIREAIINSKAKKIYVSNLRTIKGHTDGFTVKDYLNEVEKYLEPGVVDKVIYNRGRGEHKTIPLGDITFKERKKFFATDVVCQSIYQDKPGDPIQRTRVRHNSDKLAQIIIDL